MDLVCLMPGLVIDRVAGLVHVTPEKILPALGIRPTPRNQERARSIALALIRSFNFGLLQSVEDRFGLAVHQAGEGLGPARVPPKG